MSHRALILDPPTLQRRSMELLAEVDEDPKRAAERIAAAEAHVRLVVVGAAGDKAHKLLDRAIELDPYRADAYLLAALVAHREGQLGPALERYEQAATLAPGSVEIRFHCGFGFLDAARSPSLSDEDAAELADVAAEHFEAVIAIDPEHEAAAIGAVESAIYGKATKLRESLARVLSRVAPGEALLPTVTRLLYQAILAFRVGKAKGVDQKNKKTMAEVGDVARAWLAVFPSDPGLLGVIAAAAAKCEGAEELCAHLGEHARAIPDVRVLRLLVRERLAEVTDLAERVELFARAMQHVPPIDGVAHDHLQMLHLVAKRAAADGDVSAARGAWRRCRDIDPDNPSTVQNLLRLAIHDGDTDDMAALERRLFELWGTYADLSPRADVVLSRAAARAQIVVDADLERAFERFQKEEKRPSVAEAVDLVHRWVWAQALARIAAEPSVLGDGGAGGVRSLLASAPVAAFPAALQVLGRPLAGEPPVAYAFLGVAKDATDEELVKARDELMAFLAREARDGRYEPGIVPPQQHLLERAGKATRVLFDAATRARYDASTCPTPLAELYRRHTRDFRRIVLLASGVAEEEIRQRAPLAALLERIPGAMLRPYWETTMENEAWLKVTMLRVRYGGVLAKGWKLLERGESRAALDLCASQLAGASELSSAHRLYAFAALEDEGGSLWSVVESVLDHARKALQFAHWSDATPAVLQVQDLARQPVAGIAQRVATVRAGKLLEGDRSRDALHVLWSAYPGHRGLPAPAGTPVGTGFLSLAPIGTAAYAFRVGQALRENTVAWYNACRPSTHLERRRLQSRALPIVDTATSWAKYAIDTLRKDPARPPAAEQMVSVVERLLQALRRDRSALL